ncbi:hypothetical protein T47t1_112 [Escherichia phage T4]|nr:hypothetical protein T47t1_112 [Escherichia phage T4]
MNIHYPHPYDPKNKAVIIRQWERICRTKCPINSPHDVDKTTLEHSLNIPLLIRKVVNSM